MIYNNQLNRQAVSKIQYWYVNITNWQGWAWF